MKKIVVPALLVLALVGAELVMGGRMAPGAGSADLWRQEGRLQVLKADLRAWVGGADWSTDSGGHRRRLEERKDLDTSLRVLILGGGFTAGAGLEEEQLYSGLLEQHLREYTEYADAVVLQAVARGPVAERARWYAQVAQALKPDRVIIQVEAQDPAEVTPFQFVPGARPGVVAPQESSLALWRAWQRRQVRAARAAAEADVKAYVERHGWASQMTRQAHDRFVRIQSALQQGRVLEDADREYLRNMVRLEYDQDRSVQTEAEKRAWTTLLDQLLSQGARVAVLLTGPGPLYRQDRGAFRDLALEEAYTPALERHPELWVQGRPAALVHELTARALLARLGGSGFFGPSAQVPESWIVEATTLEGLQDRVLGQDLECARMAREDLEPLQDFTGDRVPLNVMRGMRPGGVVPPGETVELLCFPGYRSEAVEVVVEIPEEGPVPALQMSFARLAAREGGDAVVQDLDSGGRRITWRVTDPNVIFDRGIRLPVELSFRSEEGPVSVRLCQLEWIQAEG